jgi:hypothetical protein
VRREKLACKPGSVEYLSAFRQSFIWAGSYLPARATYPGTARAALLPPYLVLLRMGFAVPLLLPETRWALTQRSCDRPRPLRDTHRFTIAVLIAETWAVCSLWHFPSPRGVRSLTGILLCGARTFLYASELHSDCPASFTAYSTRCFVCFHDFELPITPHRTAKTNASHFDVQDIHPCAVQNSRVQIANNNKNRGACRPSIFPNPPPGGISFSAVNSGLQFGAGGELRGLCRGDLDCCAGLRIAP